MNSMQVATRYFFVWTTCMHELSNNSCFLVFVVVCSMDELLTLLQLSLQLICLQLIKERRKPYSISRTTHLCLYSNAFRQSLLGIPIQSDTIQDRNKHVPSHTRSLTIFTYQRVCLHLAHFYRPSWVMPQFVEWRQLWTCPDFDPAWNEGLEKRAEISRHCHGETIKTQLTRHV